MHVPSRDEFKAACARGNLIPVYREIMADGDTPVSAYAKLGGGEYSFLLESVVGGQTWAAYSFIGVLPKAVIRYTGGQARVTWYDGAEHTGEEGWEAEDPTAALAELMQRWQPVQTPGLPRFWGGAVGWLGYDIVRAFETLPSLAATDPNVSDLCMVITDTLVIFDNLRQTIKVVATPHLDQGDDADLVYRRACERIDQIVHRLRTNPASLSPMAPPP
ncbi:MAG: anthranilate synthase component I, partial [bacterium]|nr:anthranilate synthase component I [bacterium]